jgi:hypothetical protein
MLTAGATHNTGGQHLVVCSSDDELSIDDTPYGVQPTLTADNTGLLDMRNIIAVPYTVIRYAPVPVATAL